MTAACRMQASCPLEDKEYLKDLTDIASSIYEHRMSLIGGRFNCNPMKFDYSSVWETPHPIVMHLVSKSCTEWGTQILMATFILHNVMPILPTVSLTLNISLWTMRPSPWPPRLMNCVTYHNPYKNLRTSDRIVRYNQWSAVKISKLLQRAQQRSWCWYVLLLYVCRWGHFNYMIAAKKASKIWLN